MKEWTSNMAAYFLKLPSVMGQSGLPFGWGKIFAQRISGEALHAIPGVSPSGFFIRCPKKEEKNSLSYINLRSKFHPDPQPDVALDATESLPSVVC